MRLFPFFDNLHIYESDIEYLGGRFEYPDSTNKYFSGFIVLCNIRCQVDFMRLPDGIVVAQRYVNEDNAATFKNVLLRMVSEDAAFSSFLFIRHSRQIFCMVFEIISVIAMIIGLLSRSILGFCGFIFFLIAFILFYRRFKYIRSVNFTGDS